MSNPRPAKFYYVASTTFENYVHSVQKEMKKTFKCSCVTYCDLYTCGPRTSPQYLLRLFVKKIETPDLSNVLYWWGEMAQSVYVTSAVSS